MLQVRRAGPEDVPRILSLIRALAEYEREPDAVVATESDLLRDGFGAQPRFFVHLCDWVEGDVASSVGFAFWFFTYSTWEGAPCLHLEDLFVAPSHRGRGAGLALMRALAREALAAGCRRMVWQVLDWNAPAIEFYERIGARVLPAWRAVRMEAGAIAALAGPPGSTVNGAHLPT